MQTTMAVEDITLTLPELVDRLSPGDELILTRNHQPVAKLSAKGRRNINLVFRAWAKV